jgi:putative protein-disulfide isomerase
MGGLAPASDAPMPPQMQQYVQHHWHEVAEKTGVEFNFDFWTTCTPMRSTYPACRAVIAAGLQGDAFIPRMVKAVQQAYYQQARNPSLDSTLAELAGEIGLDTARFTDELNSAEVAQRLNEDFGFRSRLGVSGFPTLAAKKGDKFYGLSVGWSPAEVVLERLEKVQSL